MYYTAAAAAARNRLLFGPTSSYTFFLAEEQQGPASYFSLFGLLPYKKSSSMSVVIGTHRAKHTHTHVAVDGRPLEKLDDSRVGR